MTIKKLIKIASFILGCFTMQKINAQFTLRLVVNEAATRPNESFYASGSFNNWNPRDPAYLLNRLAPTGKLLYLKIYRREITRSNLPAEAGTK